MLYFIYSIIFLILIFFVSRALVKKIFRFFYLSTNNQQRSINILSWILLPGTIIHEMSHLLTAEILRVPTGPINLKPELMQNKVKAGSVKIAKTDPLRHFIVGISPTIVGIAILCSLASFYFLPIIQNIQRFTLKNWAVLMFFCYFQFVVSASMFSSKKDLQSLVFIVLMLITLSLLIYLLGINLSFFPQLFHKIEPLWKITNSGLMISFFINSLLLLFFSVSSFLPFLKTKSVQY